MLFFIFAAFSFICVRVIKSSMNYEFGSHRKRTVIRSSVVVATAAAVIAHYILATGLLNFIWTGPTEYQPAAALAILFAAATTGTLIWGFLIPKVVFSFVGTKPTDAGELGQAPHRVDENTPLHQQERAYQPETARQQTQTNEAQPYPWEETAPKRSKKPIVIGACICALLAVVAIATLALTLTGGAVTQSTLGNCDHWLRQQLVTVPQATANTENANTVVAHIQAQRPEHCPPDAWNPLVTNVARDDKGDINVNFSTASGNTRDTTVTMPGDGEPHWTYRATQNEWHSSETDNLPSRHDGTDNPKPRNETMAFADVATRNEPTTAAHRFYELGHKDLFSGPAGEAVESGDNYFAKKNYNAAINAYKQAKTLHGQPSVVLENKIGLALQELGHHEQAIVHYSKAIEIEDTVTGRVQRAFLYRETDQCQQAMHDANAALSMKAESANGFHTDAKAHRVLGVCYLVNGESVQAIRHIKAALALMEANAYPADELAVIYVALGNLDERVDEATKYYSRAITLDDTADARAGRASAYAEAQNCASASADAQAALKLPAVHWDGYHSGAEAHSTLSQCYWEAGSMHEALQHGEQALVLVRENHYDDETISFAEEVTRLLRERIASSEPSSANSHDPSHAAFAAQRTKVAPTMAAFTSQALASADETMSHHQYGQWELLTINLTAEQRMQAGYHQAKTVLDGAGQQYSCIIYANGNQVPRVNLAFQKELNYTVIRNQYDELQGNIVEANTTIGNAVAPVDWRTWATRTDKIRLRGNDAAILMRMFDEQGADEFRLNLPNNPELSSTYDIRNLQAAMAANGMTCFEGR